MVLLATLSAEHSPDLHSLAGHSPLFVSATAALFSGSTHGFPVHASLVAGRHLLVHLCTDCTGALLVRVGPACNGLLHSMVRLGGPHGSSSMGAKMRMSTAIFVFIFIQGTNIFGAPLSVINE